MSSKLDVCIAACAGAIPSTSIHEIRAAMKEAQETIEALKAQCAAVKADAAAAWRQADVKARAESDWRHRYAEVEASRKRLRAFAAAYAKHFLSSATDEYDDHANWFAVMNAWRDLERPFDLEPLEKGEQ